MPRLSPRLIQAVASKDTRVLALLRECRTLSSATNELRWLREYVQDVRGDYDNTTSPTYARKVDSAGQQLNNLILRRAKGEPLQYIIGTQPFGNLDIICRPNVLIPRPETEIYVNTVANILARLIQDRFFSSKEQTLCIADLCTGTGCIPLLLHSILREAASSQQIAEQPKLYIRGYDISKAALVLAEENLERCASQNKVIEMVKREVSFHHLDVLSLPDSAHTGTARSFLSTPWDVIISNPPYISPKDYKPGGTTSRSVRNFEPKLALVPPPSVANTMIEQSDVFYDHIIRTACQHATKLLVLEVGDSAQARRVLQMAWRHLVQPKANDEPMRMESWKDDGSIRVFERYDQIDELAEEVGSTHRFSSQEAASDRAIVIWRGSFATWRRRNPGY